MQQLRTSNTKTQFHPINYRKIKPNSYKQNTHLTTKNEARTFVLRHLNLFPTYGHIKIKIMAENEQKGH